MAKNPFTLRLFFLLVICCVSAFALDGPSDAAMNPGPYNSGYSSGSNSYQATSPGTATGGFSSFQDNWREADIAGTPQDCSGASNDFVVAIPPGACTPNVVRSDLLAEQNVPVFCKLSALKVNPLIDVSSIRSISFSGDKSEGVAGVSYHPARESVRNYDTLLSGPYLDNAGYVVISLARQPDERNLPDFVEGDLTARISYDANHIRGTGLAEYYLEPGKKRTSFWQGRGFLEVEKIEDGTASINLYTQHDGSPYKTFTLREGQESNLIYFPGYYCSAGVRIKLNRVVSPSDKALLNIDGDTIWVREDSRFLNGRCTVHELNVLPGGTGTISGECHGEKFELGLDKEGALLSSEEKDKEYSLGERIDSKKANYFLSYYGTDPEGEDFVMLTKEEPDKLDLSYINKHYSSRDWSDYSIEEFEASIGNSNEGKSRIGIYNKDYFILYPGDSIDGISFESFTSKKRDEDPYDVGYEIEKGTEVTKELVDVFLTEEKRDGVYWGEEALLEQIELTGKTQHLRTQDDLITLFEKSYPSSKHLSRIMEIKRRNSEYDVSNSHTSLKMNNEFVNILVEEFRSENTADESATIRMGGRSAEFVKEGKTIRLNDGNITIESIEASGVRFLYTPKDGSQTTGRFVALDSYGVVGGREIEVKDIETRKEAYVSVIPELQKDYSRASFSFRIGIEERNIKLNPEMTEEAIRNLDKTIAMWDDILENLGNVIKVWKAACFATSSILMLQTTLHGFDGESLSRSNVMSEYKQICDTKIAKGEYRSRTECYNDMSNKIDSDVSGMNEAIKSVNSKMQAAQQGNTQESGVLGTDTIRNQTAYVNELKNNLDWDGEKVNGIDVKTSDLTKSTEVRSILLYQKLGCDVDESSCREDSESDAACCFALENMQDKLKSAAIQKKANIEGQKATDKVDKILGGNKPSVQVVRTQDMKTMNWDGQTGGDFENLPKDIKSSDRIQFLNIGTKTYLLKLQKATLGGSMGVKKAYTLTSEDKWEEVKDLKKTGIAGFVFVGGTKEACSGNLIKNPEIRYYESGQNKGLPATVPFDVENGWYVYIPDSQASLSSSQNTYSASGDVNFFWICNAGDNGVVEHKSGDDLCQSFSSNQAGFDTFIACGMHGREVGQLYAKATDSIRQAAQAYKSTGYVNIQDQSVKRGAPLSDTGATECQDFMSPEDCKMLFNVCDPVICPPSRCDMGGKYPVSDVIQTGIVGSIALCLPNSREGIIFPVCLTGIHAGIDAFASILRSERECLKNNLETGRYVGICDEMTAIYMCELFWRQFTPLLKTLLPTMFESAFGGSTTRGGGEYLAIQSAWDNLGKSMEYFTGLYAQNSLHSPNMLGSANIGTEVCEGFVGTSIPTGISKDGFNALLAPESPSQFYAHYSEVPFSDATSPATSHYKVYYHIYAGNEFGASYQVYLRNPPISGGYNTMGTRTVKTGFVPRGKSADESIDFTAPSGYKELCVRINNQEHCGFGSVSSNFLSNYATEKYAQDQAKKEDITTEEECLSTSSSSWSLASPNLQQGLEDSAGKKDINLAGITRICSNQNPETASSESSAVCSSDNDCKSGYTCNVQIDSEIGNCVDKNNNRQASEGRWIDVGYCGDPEIRCWLDSRTLKDRFNTIDAMNEEVYGEEMTVEDSLRYAEDFDKVKQNYEMTRASLSKQYNLIRGLSPNELSEGDSHSEVASIIEELDKISGEFSSGQGTANNQAEALALKATVYRMIAEQKMKENTNIVSTGSYSPTQPKEERSSETIDTDNTFKETQKTSDSSEEENFHIETIGSKDYITVGDTVSRYFLREETGATLILKQSAGSASPVGRIESNGKILINQDKDEEIATRRLGELHNTYYTKEGGFYE